MSQQPLVIDNGSGLIKAGIAGGDRPKTVFPNLTGRPKHERVMAGGIEQDYFVGKMASQHRGLLKLDYPVSHGVIEDWYGMERVWKQVYDELSLPAEDHPVLLTEAPLNPRKNRERAAQVFFEVYNVPSLFFSTQAVLSLYASARTTGLVLDCGDGVTHAVPIYEGFSIQHAIQRMNLAGRDVTDYFRTQLQLAGYDFHTSAENEIVRILKEKACYVNTAATSHNLRSGVSSTRLAVAGASDAASNAASGVPSSASSSSVASVTSGSSASGSSSGSSSSGSSSGSSSSSSSKEPNLLRYRLPDGTVLELGRERSQAPEILFNPSLMGEEYDGIQHLLVNSINRTDRDLRHDLYSNIVLSGGTTTLKYFGERLVNEVKAIAPSDMHIKILAPPERMFTTWIGGSILASLATFKSMLISSLEYNDEGPSILHRKTL